MWATLLGVGKLTNSGPEGHYREITMSPDIRSGMETAKLYALRATGVAVMAATALAGCSGEVSTTHHNRSIYYSSQQLQFK